MAIGMRAGSLPQTLAVNPMTNRIYVANFMGNNVTVIDGATAIPIAEITPTVLTLWPSISQLTRFMSPPAAK